MTIIRFLQTLSYVSTALFSTTLHAFGFPSAPECISLPEETIEFDQLSRADVENWTPSLQFARNTQHLSIEFDQLGNTTLRQRFIPSSKGSIPVIAAAHLPPAKKYGLQQSILFESGFDWGGTWETGKIGFGLGGGSSPSGGNTDTDGFTARLIWEGNRDGTAKLGAYVYSADRTQNVPYGDVFLVDDFEIPTGTWLTYTLIVTLNTSIEESDGSLAIWINNELRLWEDGIHWQSSGENPMIDSLTYASFYGGNSRDWAPEYTTYAKLSNICYSSN